MIVLSALPSISVMDEVSIEQGSSSHQPVSLMDLGIMRFLLSVMSFGFYVLHYPYREHEELKLRFSAEPCSFCAVSASFTLGYKPEKSIWCLI